MGYGGSTEFGSGRLVGGGTRPSGGDAEEEAVEDGRARAELGAAALLLHIEGGVRQRVAKAEAGGDEELKQPPLVIGVHGRAMVRVEEMRGGKQLAVHACTTYLSVLHSAGSIEFLKTYALLEARPESWKQYPFRCEILYACHLTW